MGCRRLTVGQDATLAFTTSLEELMTSLIKQDQVPELVIDALWDIFGESCPAKPAQSN